MAVPLSERKCEPCDANTPRLEGKELEGYAGQLGDRWSVVDGRYLEGEFFFDDFMAALDFANRAGRVAEEEGHHPEICLTWGRARVKIWTHAIDGLSDNDFILAAKTEKLHDRTSS